MTALILSALGCLALFAGTVAVIAFAVPRMEGE